MEEMTVIWEKIARATEAYHRGPGQAVNIAELNEVAITNHSTRIEGSTLTANEAVVLIQSGVPASGKPIEHNNMVLDHHEALQVVLQEARLKRTLTVEFLQTIAGLVMRRTGKTVRFALGDTDESKGDFRRVAVTAGNRFFVAHDKVPGMIAGLVKRLNRQIDAVQDFPAIHQLAFIAHFDLVSIHPLTDGNGRTARLLMNFIQAYHHQPLTVIRSEYKAQYFEALEQSRERQRTDPIIAFMANQHLAWLQELNTSFENSQRVEGKGSGLSMFF